MCGRYGVATITMTTKISTNRELNIHYLIIITCSFNLLFIYGGLAFQHLISQIVPKFISIV